MTDLAAAMAILVAVTIFAFGVLVLARGALMWSDAVAGVHRARAHAASADAQISIDAEAFKAAAAAQQRVPYVPPSDDELREAIFAGRAASNGHASEYTTTLGNEGAEPDENPFDGGMYRT